MEELLHTAVISDQFPEIAPDVDAQIAVDPVVAMDDDLIPTPEPYNSSLDILKVILMLLFSVYTFSAATTHSAIVSLLCSCSFGAYFVATGYEMLRQDDGLEHRLLRAIKRSGITSAILFVSYFVINVALYIGTELPYHLSSIRFWGEILCFNAWHFPIGRSIWFVLSLLYSEVILLFLHRMDLLKLDWLWMLLAMAASLCTGELSGLVGFDVFGYSDLPNGFLTQALPCLLLGSLLWRVKNRFSEKLSNVHLWPGLIFSLIIVLLGFGLSMVEAGLFLGNSVRCGQAVGLWISSMGLCFPMILFPDLTGDSGFVFRDDDHLVPFVMFCSFDLIGICLLIPIYLTGSLHLVGGLVGIMAGVISLVLGLIVPKLWIRCRAKKADVWDEDMSDNVSDLFDAEEAVDGSEAVDTIASVSETDGKE